MSARLQRLRQMRALLDVEILSEVDRLTPSGAEGIIARTAALYGVLPEDVIGGSRQRQEVRARQAAAWLLRRTGLSSSRVGAILGCDHTTVLHAERRIESDAGTRALLIGLEVA